MKTGFKLILFFYALIFDAQAQTYFNKLYNYYSGAYSNCASTSVTLDNGDFLIGGNKFLPGFGALHFIRINVNGDTVLTKNYPKQNCAYNTAIGVSLIRCFDGNYVQAGSYIDSNTTHPDALLVKLTENGDTLWTKTYGGTNFDNANVVCQTPDSGFVMMGVTQSYSTGPASDFYMIKTDKNGNQQWQQVYGTTAVEDCVSGQITLDGGYIMSGRKSNMFHIIKTDANGIFQWQRTYSGTKGICFIKQLADSTYILTGAQAVSGLGDQGCITKISKTGGVIWQQAYGGIANDWFYTQPVILNDGSIIAGGHTMSGGFPIGWLVKTDSLGNELWQRTYYANLSNDNYVYDLKATADNGFIIVGSGNITGQDAWVVKVDEFGCEVSNCSVGITEAETAAEQLKIYPNPATNHVTVEINNDEAGPTQLIIYDVFGKEMAKEQVNNSNSLTINIQHFANGMYLLVLKSGNEIKEKQKLIITK